MEKAKPFVKWVGGKKQLLKTIDEHLPQNFRNRAGFTYVEPFVGGGAVLFWMLKHHPNIKRAIINDINPDLAATYKAVRDIPSQLIIRLKDIESEYLSLSDEARKEYFLSMRERFNTKSLDSVENSTLFIFLNRTCFNGLYRVNSSGLFNVPFGRYKNPKICDEVTIQADSKLLQRVEVLTGDFEQTLSLVDDASFFYFDPPYRPLSKTSSFNSYAKEDFNDLEQIRLANFCRKIDALGHTFLLSNSDPKGVDSNDSFFEDHYSAFLIERVYATRMVNSKAEGRGKLTELLVTNGNNL